MGNGEWEMIVEKVFNILCLVLYWLKTRKKVLDFLLNYSKLLNILIFIWFKI